MDTKKIKQIIDLFEESNLARLEVEVDGMKIGMEKPKPELNYVSSPVTQMAAVSAFPEAQDIKPIGEEVKSPLVGTFYAAAGAGKKPFVEIGSKIKKGDTLAIIEAMKVMNEIKASRDGEVSSIKIKDGETVQFNDVLMYII